MKINLKRFKHISQEIQIRSKHKNYSKKVKGYLKIIRHNIKRKLQICLNYNSPVIASRHIKLRSSN